MFEKTNINEKEAGVDPFFKKSFEVMCTTIEKKL